MTSEPLRTETLSDRGIRIESVSKVFFSESGEPVVALNDVSLRIRQHEFVTIVGRSGCGKSTLLRIVAGLTPPTQGTVHLDNELIHEPRRDVGMVFQRPALLPWRSILDNIVLPIEILGLSRSEHVQRAKDLLRLVGLEEFEGHRPYELSGGMQQRAAMCRSLIHNPAVLLMDEPFAALDALTREELAMELQRMWLEHRKTIIFVTHSISEAVMLADRVIVMTPRPGEIAREVKVDVPRPRSLQDSKTSAVLQRTNEEVHSLLFAPDVRADGAPSSA